MEIPYVTQARPDTGLYNAKVGIWLFLASEVMLFGGLFSSYIFLRMGADPGRWPYQILDIWPALINTFVLILSSVTVVLGWAYAKMGQYKLFKLWFGVTFLCAVIFVSIKGYEYHAKFHHYGVILKNDAEVTGHVDEEKTTSEVIALMPDVHQSHESGALYLKERGVKPVEHGTGEHAIVLIPRSEVKWFSNFMPRYSTFFAIYFTLTGLHALHVIGGAIVIFYFWMPGSKMFFTDRPHFVNRLEVVGLFWHFVELVWIFLFPMLYLL